MSAKQIEAFVKQLQKLADKADEHSLILPNGAEVGSLLAVIADDLKKRYGVNNGT